MDMIYFSSSLTWSSNLTDLFNAASTKDATCFHGLFGLLGRFFLGFLGSCLESVWVIGPPFLQFLFLLICEVPLFTSLVVTKVNPVFPMLGFLVVLGVGSMTDEICAAPLFCPFDLFLATGSDKLGKNIGQQYCWCSLMWLMPLRSLSNCDYEL